MNVDQVISTLRTGEGKLPPALKWALDHWSNASDRLLAQLRSIAANLADDPDSDAFDDSDAEALLFLTHLFAEKRDSRAFAPVCRRLARDRQLSAWLGFRSTEQMAGLLIALNDGDLELLTQLIERTDGDENVRAAAFMAWSYLVRLEGVAPETARAFLQHFLDKGAPRAEDAIWCDWAWAAARIGFEDLGPQVARLISRNWIGEKFLSMQDFYAELAEFRLKPQAAFAARGIEPFDDVVSLAEEVERDFEGLSPGLDESARTGGAPLNNPFRSVGRNDPCPCGSGKKFKKCCIDKLEV